MKRALLAFALSLLALPAEAQLGWDRWPSAYVPNADTATAIARAVLAPIYGADHMRREEPLVAERNGDIWTVRGTLHCEGWLWEKWHKMLNELVCVGGTAEIKLSAKDGRVLHVTHYQ